MTGTNHDHDDAIELPETRQHDDHDGAVAVAVRSALSDSDAWTDTQLHQIAQAAGRRAERQRRARLVRTPAVLLASAAAVAALAAVVPPVLRPMDETGQGPVAAGTTNTSPSAEAPLLTDEEVHRVLPSADPLDSNDDPRAVPPVPQDACGTSTLASVDAPAASRSSTWGIAGGDVEDSAGDGPLVQLEVTVDSFADAAHANGYADALSESISTCTPLPGTQQPTYPFSTLARIASALYVTGYSDGVLAVTAVQVDGAHAATVRALVPVAEDPQTLTTDPDQPVAPVPGADRAALGEAVRAVVTLASSAAERAASA